MTDANAKAAQATPNAAQGQEANNGTSQGQNTTSDSSAKSVEKNATQDQGKSAQPNAAKPGDPASQDGGKANAEPAKETLLAGFDLKLPENSSLSQDHVEKIKTFSKERGFSQEQAQAILEHENSLVSESRTKAVADYIVANRPGGQDWSKRESEWRKECLSDPAIGGSEEKLREMAALGNRALEQLFSPEVKQFLLETGLGSHPKVLRDFANLGRKIGNDTLVHGDSGTKGHPKSIADRMFGSQESQQQT